MWGSIYSFILVQMVYIAFSVLILGIIFKLLIVVFSPKIKGTLGMFPVKIPRAAGIIKDSFLAPAAFIKDKVFWFFIMLFHIAFFLLIIGHFELVREFPCLQIIQHDVFLGAGFVGIALAVSTIYFLFRRFRPPHSLISIPEDYILLILLFFTIITGSHMHLASRYGIAGFDIPVEDYRAYLSSLIAFSPVIPDGISGSPHFVIVSLHIFFANLFMMIFPFSKLIHSVFIFMTQNIKRKSSG